MLRMRLKAALLVAVLAVAGVFVASGPVSAADCTDLAGMGKVCTTGPDGASFGISAHIQQLSLCLVINATCPKAPRT